MIVRLSSGIKSQAYNSLIRQQHDSIRVQLKENSRSNCTNFDIVSVLFFFRSAWLTCVCRMLFSRLRLYLLLSTNASELSINFEMFGLCQICNRKQPDRRKFVEHTKKHKPNSITDTALNTKNANIAELNSWSPKKMRKFLLLNRNFSLNGRG